MNDKLSAIKSRLKLQGYRLTGPRETILKAMMDSPHHISADNLYISLKSKGARVGLTTIYRALDHLTRAGIVRKMNLGADRCVFELMDEKISGHHHHLICRNCQRVIDYADFPKEEIDLIRKLEEIVSKRHKFQVDDHQISFSGLCRLCRR